MKMTNDKLVYEYVATILSWVYDDTRRGKDGKRNKIKKLGKELVARGLLTQEDADKFYEGAY